MNDHERDPLHEEPKPPIVQVDEADLEVAWQGEGDDTVRCPACEAEPKGRFAERGTSEGGRWVSFAPCGHVLVLADWAVA